MKKIITAAILFISIGNLIAQKDFKWEKVDSIQKSKSEIYADTKMFIAETWKSAKDVIQNDDKESGVILIKGKSSIYTPFMLNGYTYVYSYTITFKMKDNKYKINIDQVHFDDGWANGAPHLSAIEPFDGDNYPGMPMSGGLPKGKAVKMMEQLKADLQGIFDSYNIQIIKPSVKDAGW